MRDGTTRRCIETHPKHGLRCEGDYQHEGIHSYTNWGAMITPITWDNHVPLRLRRRIILAWRALTGEDASA